MTAKKETTNPNDTPLPATITEGIPKGLSRMEYLQWLQARFSQVAQDNKSNLWKSLYESIDKTLVTENPPYIIATKLRMRMIEHALDRERTKPLVQCWREDFNDEMIAYKRQGRLEGLGALQALEMQSGEDSGAKL